MVWYSHLLKNFPQFVVIYTLKGFGVVIEEEVDVFLKFSSFFLRSNRWQFDLFCLLPFVLLPFLNPAENLEVFSSHTVESQLILVKKISSY